MHNIGKIMDTVVNQALPFIALNGGLLKIKLTVPLTADLNFLEEGNLLIAF